MSVESVVGLIRFACVGKTYFSFILKSLPFHSINRKRLNLKCKNVLMEKLRSVESVSLLQVYNYYMIFEFIEVKKFQTDRTNCLKRHILQNPRCVEPPSRSFFYMFLLSLSILTDNLLANRLTVALFAEDS